MSSAEERQQIDAIQDIREQLVAVFNEALQTHGPALTMTAMTTFAASVCHHAERLMDEPNARKLVMGHWEDGFYGYLKMLNNACDGEKQ